MNNLISFFSLESIGLSFFDIAALYTVILIAAVIRGYAGFGFSAIVVASASLFCQHGKSSLWFCCVRLQQVFRWPLAFGNQ
jgi:hypothetical protein